MGGPGDAPGQVVVVDVVVEIGVAVVGKEVVLVAVVQGNGCEGEVEWRILGNSDWVIHPGMKGVSWDVHRDGLVRHPDRDCCGGWVICQGKACIGWIVVILG